MLATGLLLLALQDPAWMGLGGSDAGQGLTRSNGTVEMQRLFFSAGGRPIVCHKKSGSLYAYQWNDLAWEAMGPAGAVNGSISATNMAAAVDHYGNPMFAWQGSSGVNNIFFRWWNWSTQTWDQLGTSGTGNGVSNLTAGSAITPALAVDADNFPVIAWQYLPNGSTTNAIYAARWSGSAWVEAAPGSLVGNGLSSSTIASTLPVMASNRRGDVIVTWNQGFDLYVRQFTASEGAWSGIANASDTIEMSLNQSVAIDENGNSFLAWRDGATSAATILLKKGRWTGTAWLWTGVGGSATAPGVAGGSIATPAVAVDRTGRPFVAYQKSLGGTPSVFDIQLRYWDGATWKGISGSETGGGISNTAATSSSPSIAVSPWGAVGVSWREAMTSTTWEAYYRQAQFSGPALTSLGQWRRDGSAEIPAHGVTGPDPAFSVRVAAGPDPGNQPVFVEVEVQPSTSPFTGLPTAQATVTAGSGSIDVIGLTVGTRVHWQARVVNAFGASGSGWQGIPPSPDGVDLIVRDNQAPAVIRLAQFFAQRDAMVARGQSVYTKEKVQAAGLLFDDDDDAIRIEIELRPAGLPFRGEATAIGDWTASSDVSVADFPASLGPIHWQARAVDEYLGTSDWMAFGDGLSADFVMQENGSLGGGFCDASANGTAPLMVALLAILVILSRR